MDDTELLGVAREAVERSYAPYSEYRVGAALEAADGTVYTGCNVENANYSNSVHAEEFALSKAVEDGHRSFARVAVSSDRRDGVTPCGMCRQSLAEFCDDDFRVICEGGSEDETPATYTLGVLLPNAIAGEDLR
jgi:cytidine deaminase